MMAWVGRWLLVLFAFGAACGDVIDDVSAASVTYSWSGTVRLYDAFGADPWSLGSDGAQFTFATSVDVEAADGNSVQIGFAEFVGQNVEFRLDGEELVFIGDSLIDFVDTADTYDYVTMGGTFIKGRDVVRVSSVVTLPSGTYAFSLLSERPPLFAATENRAFSSDLLSPYVLSVEVGTSVTAIPEPGGWSILCVGIAAISALMRGTPYFRFRRSHSGVVEFGARLTG